jgi:hypothetical protein
VYLCQNFPKKHHLYTLFAPRLVLNWIEVGPYCNGHGRGHLSGPNSIIFFILAHFGRENITSVGGAGLCPPNTGPSKSDPTRVRRPRHPCKSKDRQWKDCRVLYSYRPKDSQRQIGTFPPKWLFFLSLDFPRLKCVQAVSGADLSKQVTRAVILVPTRELAEQVSNYLKTLLKYCEGITSVNAAAGATTHLQRCVDLAFGSWLRLVWMGWVCGPTGQN